MFFTKPIEEPNVIPPTNPAEDPRLIQAEKRLREARRLYLDASFQVDAYRARHKGDPGQPFGISDGTTVRMYVPVGLMQREDPKLRALCNEKERTRRAFHEAQRVLVSVKTELGILK